MPESANNEEIVLLSKWEELISQTNIVPLKKEDEEIPQYTITIQQPEGATITVALDGTNHTETFDADKGSVYTVSLSGDNARYLVPNTEGGKLTDNVTISATDYRSDPIPERCAIIILQDSAEDQIIRAHVTNMDGNGNDGITDYRNSIWVSPGAKAEFYLEIPFQRKWDPGKLNVEVLDPVTKNVNYVYATPPIIRSDFDPTIVIVTVIQVPHMTIHIWVTPPGGGAETEYTSSFNPKIGSTYRITTTMESDWYEGGMVSFPLVGSFTQDCTITGRSPEMVYFTVHIIQSAHQTITVSCNGAKYTSDFKARKGSVWTASIVATEANWRAGTLSPGTSGTITADVTISASAAKFTSQTLNMVPPWEGCADLYKPFTAINSIVSLWIPYGNIDGSDEGGHSGNPGNACWIQCTDSGKLWFNSDYTNDGERTCWVRVTPGKTYNLHAYGRIYKGRGYGFVLTQNDTVESQANRVWTEDL